MKEGTGTEWEWSWCRVLAAIGVVIRGLCMTNPSKATTQHPFENTPKGSYK
jgi:hypothetical protein